MKIMVMTVIMKMILNILFFSKCIEMINVGFFLRFNKYKVKHMSSVKWGHLENFEPNSIK